MIDNGYGLSRHPEKLLQAFIRSSCEYLCYQGLHIRRFSQSNTLMAYIKNVYTVTLLKDHKSSLDYGIFTYQLSYDFNNPQTTGQPPILRPVFSSTLFNDMGGHCHKYLTTAYFNGVGDTNVRRYAVSKSQLPHICDYMNGPLTQ